MKIALTGKGGVGKTTIAGALARHFAAAGHKVVAVDGDPNPNLGLSLGLDPDEVEAMEPILNALQALGFTHRDPQPDPEELLDRYGVTLPDGTILISTGKVERPSTGCLCCGSHTATRTFFGALRGEDRVVVADLEAGLNDLIWARPGADDVVLAVAEQTAKSIEIARRACRIAEGMGVRRVLGVANLCVTDDDAEQLAEILGVPVLAVPRDPAVARSDHLGIEVDATSPAMVAIGELAQRLVGEPATP